MDSKKFEMIYLSFPGTGKTSFTLAPAVLARLAAAEDDGKRLVTVVTAPSHTAVDEAMDDIVELWAQLTDETVVTAATQFGRVRSGSADRDDGRPQAVADHVARVNYYDSGDVVDIYRWT